MGKVINWKRVHKSYVNGMSIDEIASKLNLKPSTIRVKFCLHGLVKQPKTDPKIDYKKIFDEHYINTDNRLEDVAKITGIKAAILQLNFSKRGLFKKKQARTTGEKKDFIEFNKRKYTTDYRGRYRSTTKPQTFLKRDVWIFYNGPLGKNERVHLKDSNEQNCLDINNLYVIKYQE